MRVRTSWPFFTLYSLPLSRLALCVILSTPPQTGANPAPREDVDVLQFNISIVVTAEAVALILFLLLRFCG